MIKKTIKQAMSSFKDKFGNNMSWPKVVSDNITVNMDGGVGGSWKVECAIDEEVVGCDEMDNPPFVGVPAPAYLEDDPWFGPAPVKTETQMDYMEKETEIKKQEEEKRKEYNGEPCNMHQLMYEMATSNWNTVKETQGGSENFQGGSENIHG